MSEDLERSYRRLLSSYPQSWRQRNEEVVLGTLLDEAEAEGWSKPRWGQRFSLVFHGLAERISLKTVAVLAVVALALSVCGTVLQIAMLESPSPAWRVAMFMSIGLPGWLVVIALCGLLRNLGWLGHMHSIVVSMLAVPALIAGLLAMASWSQGFMEADSGLPQSDFGNLFIVFAMSGLSFGTLAAAVLYTGLLARTMRGTHLRQVSSLLLGVGTTLSAGVSLAGPGTVPVLALGIFAAALWVLSARKPGPVRGAANQASLFPHDTWVAERGGTKAVPAARASRILAGVSAIAGLGAVAFALTGSTWMDGGLDSTQTMRLGIAFGYVAAIPFAFALVQGAGTRPGTLAWPLILIVTAMLISAAGAGFGDGSGDLVSMVPMAASALVASVAVGWSGGALLRERGSSPFGAFGPVVIGLGFLVVLGFFWASMAPFAIPVLAALVALLPPRRRARVLAAAGA